MDLLNDTTMKELGLLEVAILWGSIVFFVTVLSYMAYNVYRMIKHGGEEFEDLGRAPWDE